MYWNEKYIYIDIVDIVKCVLCEKKILSEVLENSLIDVKSFMCIYIFVKIIWNLFEINVILCEVYNCLYKGYSYRL